MLHGLHGVRQELHTIHSSHEAFWEAVGEFCTAPENKALCRSLGVCVYGGGQPHSWIPCTLGISQNQ